jgi:hypothetical protein
MPAVVTISAPFDPAHITGLFRRHIDAIEVHGEIEVTLAGRPFRIRRALLDDVNEQRETLTPELQIARIDHSSAACRALVREMVEWNAAASLGSSGWESRL